jgi:hypothetical protein
MKLGILKPAATFFERKRFFASEKSLIFRPDFLVINMRALLFCILQRVLGGEEF